ncbi:MAG: hypothetical protein LC670_04925, partial [Flavobacteriales bacterium]|nr:hypothetical protein [Flavobacteriales bacterium]
MTKSEGGIIMLSRADVPASQNKAIPLKVRNIDETMFLLDETSYSFVRIEGCCIYCLKKSRFGFSYRDLRNGSFSLFIHSYPLLESLPMK